MHRKETSPPKEAQLTLTGKVDSIKKTSITVPPFYNLRYRRKFFSNRVTRRIAKTISRSNLTNQNGAFSGD
jgi:TolB-like protein